MQCLFLENMSASASKEEKCMCFEIAVSRRQFVSILGIMALSPLGWMEAGAANEETILLPSTMDQYTPSFFAYAFDRIGDAATRAGARLRFAFMGVENQGGSVALSFEKKDKGGNAFPVLRQEDGRMLYVTHGGHGRLDRMEFSSSAQEFLARLKQRTLHFFKTLKAKIDSEDVITLGVKAVAIGIGVWIGIQLAAFVLATLGVFVYYALIVALIIAGVMVIDVFLRGRFSVGERMKKMKEQFMQKTTRFPELAHTISS